jgi:hypothetical protein
MFSFFKRLKEVDRVSALVTQRSASLNETLEKLPLPPVEENINPLKNVSLNPFSPLREECKNGNCHNLPIKKIEEAHGKVLRMADRLDLLARISVSREERKHVTGQ